MSAVLQAREPGAKYLAHMAPPLVRQFDMLATAPDGVSRLRELILTLAVQGKLVPQQANETTAARQLEEIAEERSPEKAAQKRGRRTETADEFLEPFPLPCAWTWSRLGDVTHISGGVTLGRKGAIAQPLTLPYLRVANVQRWRVQHDDLKSVTIATAELARFQLREGDLLITEGGDWDKVGRTAIWRGEVPLCLHQNHVFKARGLTPTWNPAWAELYLNSPVARAYFAASAKQTTNLASINMTQLKACPFPLPPLAEQARIVARVDELMRLCDALEANGRLEAEHHQQLLTTLLGTLTDSRTPEELAENWQRVADHFDLLLNRPAAVDALEQTVLQLAVRGLLVGEGLSNDAETNATKGECVDPIPHDWTRLRFGDVVSMLNGYAFKSEWFQTSGTRLVRNVNVGHGRLDWQQAAHVSPAIADEFSQFALAEGDVVLTLDRPIISTGLKLAVVRRDDLPCLLLQRVARLSPDTRVLSRDFMLLWLRSDSFVKAIDPGRSNGVPHISTKQVASLTLDLPPLEEQDRIVARVARVRQLCSTLRQRLTAGRTAQSQLAEAMIDQAIAA